MENLFNNATAGFVASLLLGFAAAIISEVLSAYRVKRIGTKEMAYKEKIDKLAKSLTATSGEIDTILTEMRMVVSRREDAIENLEAKLSELSAREEELKTKVKSLEKVPLPALEYFLQATEKNERRSAFRDYMLFALGVVVTTIITIILKTFFHI